MKTNNTFFGNHCIILTRVSTFKQDFTGQNLDLIKYAKSLGYDKVTEISTKESGFRTFNSKEGFGLVLEYLKNNSDCKTIFITELNRIGRNRKVITDIEYYLIDEKIQLYVKDSNLQLFDDSGNLILSNRLMFSIYASFAESEMQTKKLRFERERRKNFSLGISIQGNPLFGYRKVYNESIKKNVLEINEEKAKQIRDVFSMYLNGIDKDITKSSIKLITLECIKKGYDKYLHSKRNVNKLLKEEGYTGFKITKNKRKNPEYWDYKMLDKTKYIYSNSYEIKYPQILDKNVFEDVQNKLSVYNSRLEKNISNNELTDKSNKHTTILNKLIVCPVCNHYYRGEYLFKNDDHKHFYRCSNSKAIINKCTNKSTLSMIQIDSVIWSFLKENITQLVEQINNYYNDTDKETIIEQIENLKMKIIEFEEEKENESNTFRIIYKRAKNKEQEEENYNKTIDLIDSKINEIKILISKNETILNDLEVNFNKNIRSEIENKINEIESNKEEIKKYVRQLIKKIVPVYSDLKYTVLNIKTVENLGYSLIDRENDFDKNKLPELKKHIAEIDYYIIINKKDNNRIKIKYIENQKNFRFEENEFIFNEKSYSISNLFEINNIDMFDDLLLKMSKEQRLNFEKTMISVHLKNLEYKRFSNDLYLDDIKSLKGFAK